jgi:hydrogenase nickel incorporation protein HypA/HybF
MHEFSIARSIVDVATAEAERVGARRVKRLNCRIGEMCQVDGRLISEAFDIACRGTICEDAELQIETTHMHAVCPQCWRRFEVHNWNWTCPHCGVEGEKLDGGDELELVSIEAEVDDDYSGDPEGLGAERTHGARESPAF